MSVKMDSLPVASLPSTVGVNSATPSVFDCAAIWLKSAGSKVHHAASAIFSSMAAWSGDTNAIACTLRKLDGYVLVLVEYLRDAPSEYRNFKQQVSGVVGVIDFVQILGDIKYVIREKWRKDSNLGVAAQAALTVADTSGCLIWLQDLGALKLSKIAKSIGKSQPFSFVPKIVEKLPLLEKVPNLHKYAAKLGEARVFSFVNNLSVFTVGFSSLMLFYTLSAVKTVQTLISANGDYTRWDAGLSLAAHLSELSLGAVVFFQVVNPVSMGLVGTAAIALTAASFIYKNMYSVQIKQEQKGLKV